MIGKVTSKEASREIIIGYDNTENVEQIDIEKIITDIESQAVVDSFLMIYFNKEKILDTNQDLGKPDVHISVMSPKQSSWLIDSRLWFTNEGAVIGIRSGESWDQVDYFEINKNDANYIKDQIESQED